jgi:glutathione S-transferase
VLKIWGRKNSVNVQKVLWCAAELDLDYERIDAGLEFGLNNEEWFLALNPNGRVPLIQDGDFTLWESNSIVRYLCATHDLGGLYPKSPRQRAAAERWMDWQLSTLAGPTSIAFRNLVRTPPGKRDAAAVTYRWLALQGIERPAWPSLERWQRELGLREGFRAHVMLPLS